MENASKALIIAGAILISILLISVGILIFNSVSGTTNNADAAGDAMEIAAISERAKIILETNDIMDPLKFNRFILDKYGGAVPIPIPYRYRCSRYNKRTSDRTM